MQNHSLEELTNQIMACLFVELEASARHVHVTKEQANILFGHDLTPKRPLSQPGQFLAQERVAVVGPKGELNHVAVLGPARKEAQVEVSMTDARILGLQPPIRESGKVAGSPGVVLRSEKAELAIKQGVIIAQRHLHLTPEDAQRFAVADRQVVRLQVFTERPLIFQDVLVRVRPDFATRAHLDFDEANACAMQPGDLGRILP
jgi:propanediol utilization protein